MKTTTNSLQLREIVVMASIAIVFGIIYLLAIFFGQIVEAIFGPVVRGFVAGIWIMAPVMCAYIIRKPGVALIAQMIAAITEVLVGSVNAGVILLVGFTQGLAAEMIFAAFRWKKYHIIVLMLAGAAGTLANFITQIFTVGLLFAFSPIILTLMLITMLISGAFVAGWGSKLLADALCQTGVLNQYALGKEYQAKRMNEHGLH